VDVTQGSGMTPPDWASVEWLLDHHRTKEEERRQMVADLSFQPGDVLLDLGCGPGLWAPLLAERVASTGKVIGADRSPEFISYAARHRGEWEHLVEFILADFSAVPFADNAFDAVFFGNCSAYVTNAAEVLEEQKRVTKKGGRIVAKDFDGGVLIFEPMDPDLSLQVLAAVARSLKERPMDPPFDNFVGRKLHGIFVRAGFEDVVTESYAINKVAPLKPEAKRYLVGNAAWYAQTAAPHLSEDVLRRWREHFQPDSDQYILDREDFYFCMIEVVTVATV
jgi:ubiquinone/menaquinone biosynthesis C-methylase UbiE